MGRNVSKASSIVGWILAIIPGLLLLFSAAMKFAKPAQVDEGMAHLGWPTKLTLQLGIIELACTILFLIPQTTVLGAILLTGYLGGAMATHMRIEEPVYTHIVIGVVLWLSIYLRDARLRPLAPLRMT